MNLENGNAATEGAVGGGSGDRHAWLADASEYARPTAGPQAPTDEDKKEFLLASARAAVANLRTWQLEVETVCVGLKGGFISFDDAVSALDDIGVLAYLPEPEQTAAA